MKSMHDVGSQGVRAGISAEECIVSTASHLYGMSVKHLEVLSQASCGIICVVEFHLA